MKNHIPSTRRARALGWLCAGALAVGVVLVGTVRSQIVPAEYVLVAPPDVASDFAERHGLTIEDRVDGGHGVTLLSGELDADELNEVEIEVAADDRIEDFEPNRMLRVTEVADADLGHSTAAILEALPDRTPVPYYGATAWKGYVEQPAARLVRVNDAQNQYGTGAAAVAIIDTEVDTNHPLLRGRIRDAYDFTGEGSTSGPGLTHSTAAILEGGGPDERLDTLLLNGSVAAILEHSTAAILETNGPPPDAFGHGTMVAGLVHLVAPTAEIMPLTAFTANGDSNLFNIVRAIYYAVDHDARVINMSFSMEHDSRAVAEAIKYATDHGVITVAAAGNAASGVNVFPASYSNTIGVASTSDADVRSLFSNFGGAIVSVAAPGERLITAYPGGHYAAVWGTSFSSGLVSGTAALLVQSLPNLRQGDFENALAQGARKIRQDVGQGRLDIYTTLQRKVR